jgi:hypothetical protein
MNKEDGGMKENIGMIEKSKTNWDFQRSWEYRLARMAAYDALRHMGVITKWESDSILLTKLLGHDEGKHFLLGDDFSEEDYYKCKLLAGPHGYSIYKMLCIKHGLLRPDRVR